MDNQQQQPHGPPPPPPDPYPQQQQPPPPAPAPAPPPQQQQPQPAQPQQLQPQPLQQHPPPPPRPLETPLPPASALISALENANPTPKPSSNLPQILRRDPTPAPAHEPERLPTPAMGPPLPPMQMHPPAQLQPPQPPQMQQQVPTTPSNLLWSLHNAGQPPPSAPAPLPQTLGPPPPPPQQFQAESASAPGQHPSGFSFGPPPPVVPTPQPLGPPAHQPQPQTMSPRFAPPQVTAEAMAQPLPDGVQGGDDSEAGGGRLLNVRDALTYLDQVKNEFTDRADVYNLFLDIMKDFKSQNIDTPRVIQRVSHLFQGHNQLIQGFNTFLPPGYRIETSQDPQDPNTIVVTTPQGTMTTNSAIDPAWPPAQRALVGFPQQQGPPQQGAPPQGSFSLLPPLVQGPPGPGAPPGHFGPQVGLFPSPQPLPLSHQHVHQHSHTHAHPLHAHAPHAHSSQPQTPMPPPPAPPPPGPGQPMLNAEVPINHAMNFVNAIKVRFEHDPDKYKAFLDILQTYQQRQRPIHDVYAQVHELFDGQADLIAEFQEFLPGKGRWGTISGFGDLLAEEAAAMGPPGHEAGKRDMGGGEGALTVAASARERERERERDREEREKREKRERARESQAVKRKKRPAEKEPVPPPGGKGRQPAKKAKHHHNKEPSPPPPSPTRHTHHTHTHSHSHAQPAPAPVAPPPAPPQPPAVPSVSSFFDRLKRHVDDRTAHQEFMKLLNLFSQGVLPIRSLLERARPFLGENRELWKGFCEVCGVEERDAEGIITGRGEMGGEMRGRDGEVLLHPLERPQLNLNKCKTYGPSYRKLPKSEINIECSGRDQLCWQVLNDSWVSHPTWASEDTGFSSHKKNMYEEAMHRSEEERHEFDYHIEANMRTIALLEPIAVRLLSMDAEEKAKLRLPPGLGGQSKGVYARVIKKIYGNEAGVEILQALQENPAAAVPVILSRLKLKDDEWRRSQREWNKVWREVEARNFYKSLDHMGITFKQDDKKRLTPKRMVEEIESVKAEQDARRAREGGARAGKAGRWQLEYVMEDVGVLQDVVKLVLSFLDRGQGTLGTGDRQRVETFIRAWVPMMFGVNAEEFCAPFGSRVCGEESSEDEAVDEGSVPPPAAVPARANGHAAKRGGGGRKKARTGRHAARGAREAQQESKSTDSNDASVALPRTPSPKEQPASMDERDVVMADQAVETIERAAQAWIEIAPVDMQSGAGMEFGTQVGEGGQPVAMSSARDEDVDVHMAPGVPEANGTKDDDDDDAMEGIEEAQAPRVVNGDVPMLDAVPEIRLNGEIGIGMKPAKSSGRRVFFANTPFYILFRLIQTMYSRLHTLKYQGEPSLLTSPNPLAIELGLVASQSVRSGTDAGTLDTTTTTNSMSTIATVSVAHMYTHLLVQCERVFEGELDMASFEETARALFGTSAYLMFSFVGVITQIVKQANIVVQDQRSQDLFGFFKEEIERQSGLGAGAEAGHGQGRKGMSDVRAQIAYRRVAENVLGDGENMFRLEWAGDAYALRCALVGKEDPSAEEPAGNKERWRAYVESYMLIHPTENIPDVRLRQSFLSRDLPSNTNRPPAMLARSALQIRVCVRTYRLFYVPRTEEWMFRERAQRETQDEFKRKVQDKKKASARKMKNWVDMRIRGGRMRA